MARSNADLLAIKAELTNNPLALTGYLPPTAPNDEANANALNLVRPECAIDRESIPMYEIFLHIDLDEYSALSPTQRQWLDSIGAAGGTINPKTGGEIREGLLQCFGAVTETRTKLLTILTAPASRVEQLFKAGTLEAGGSVTASDVANARAAV